jgi:hypothetical protein
MTPHALYRALGGTRTELNRGLSKALYAISAAAIYAVVILGMPRDNAPGALTKPGSRR